MTLPWEKNAPQTPSIVDSVAGAKIDDEIRKVSGQIPQASTSATPSQSQFIKAGPSTGKAYEYQDAQGNVKQWKGRGRKPEPVKRYFDGDLSAVKVIDYNYGAGVPGPQPQATPEKKEGFFSFLTPKKPLPEEGTPEYKDRMDKSVELSRKLAEGIQTHYKNKYNNIAPTEEDRERDKAILVIGLTPAMFKYYSVMMDMPEVVALVTVGQYHFQHNKYISYTTGKPIPKELFLQEKAAREGIVIEPTSNKKVSSKKSKK
jgi:hypothetical protein